MTRPIVRPAASRSLVLALASLACTPTPNILPTNDLNRPTDIAFMCLGAFGADDATARSGPVRTRSRAGRCASATRRPSPTRSRRQPAASMQNRTFAFVPNSASGDLSVIDADTWKIVDLNKATGGYGRVPLGTLPEQISTTSDGCRLVSANRGSCDLSLVDPSTLLAPACSRPNTTTPARRARSRPATASSASCPLRGDGTPLGAAPYEAVFLPQDTHADGNS